MELLCWENREYKVKLSSNSELCKNSNKYLIEINEEPIDYYNVCNK